MKNTKKDSITKGETMNDIKLLRIALVIGIAGIVALFFLSKAIQADSISIGKITEQEIGRKIMVEGIIESVAEKKSTVLFDIQEQDTPESISVILFGKSSQPFKKGSEVRVIGTVKDYNGKLEIVAEKINTIEN